ncbi:PHP domain-containing protein [Nanchangia anserum]|uniref:PHP domain-containing protein n=1 Tax=Nanchangia anserum TaxID=2692125 RepID=A0A8I0GFF5_9ACTO|nr:PHP domain-containing protein [Nanchangia anserum]MBD3689044.1 PHP domain-containing protein [Nanchangia anserum]QOX81288.1 PHP domain-containing protein [Nanchangia anserum]
MSIPRIDPHAHTRCSDGTDSPRELMAAARAAGLSVVGITDHDTTAGWDEAAAAVDEVGVGLLRGAEVSCSWRGITVHMLSYLHDPAHRALRDLYADIHAARQRRITEMVSRISRDYPIDLDDVTRQAGPGVAIGRPHIADALIEAGCFRHRNEVFARVLAVSSPYYVRYDAPDARDVIRAIRDAGGVPVLAHPRPLNRQRRVIPGDEIGRWARAGLFGVEVDHPDHTAEWRVAVSTIARRYGLVETGSSDYHGRGKTTRLGDNLTAPSALERIVAEGCLPLLTPALR